MEEIQDLSKEIGFKNLAYVIRVILLQNLLQVLKDPLGFYRNIKEGYITLKKSEEEQKELKSKIN